MAELLTIKETAARLAVCRTTVYRLLRDPDFPRPFALTDDVRRWDAAEIDAWVESRRERAVRAA